MIDLRRVAIIFVIGALFAIFVNAFIGAVYPSPKYEDFCKAKYFPERPYTAPVKEGFKCPDYDLPNQEVLDKCANDNGYPEYSYDGNGCPMKYTGCNFCQRDFNDATQKHNYYYFIISSVLALIGIAIGLWLPIKNSLNEWIATGFLLGSLFTLFFGTFRYYEHLGRFVKPVVILVELLLVIYLSYKKLQDFREDHQKDDVTVVADKVEVKPKKKK